MAKRKGKGRPKDPKIPQTAAEKEARVGLTIAKQLGLAQNRAKQTATSRGAFKERALRSAGDMSRYNLGRFKDDPFPALPSGGTGPTTAGPASSRTGTGARTSPKPGKPKKGIIAGKGGMQERGELKPKGAPPRPKGTISGGDGQLAMERRREQEAARKADAAKKAAARKKAATQSKDQGTYRAPTRSTQTAM